MAENSPAQDNRDQTDAPFEVEDSGSNAERTKVKRALGALAALFVVGGLVGSSSVIAVVVVCWDLSRPHRACVHHDVEECWPLLPTVPTPLGNWAIAHIIMVCGNIIFTLVALRNIPGKYLRAMKYLSGCILFSIIMQILFLGLENKYETNLTEITDGIENTLTGGMFYYKHRETSRIGWDKLQQQDCCCGRYHWTDWADKGYMPDSCRCETGQCKAPCTLTDRDPWGDPYDVVFQGPHYVHAVPCSDHVVMKVRKRYHLIKTFCSPIIWTLTILQLFTCVASQVLIYQCHSKCSLASCSASYKEETNPTEPQDNM